MLPGPAAHLSEAQSAPETEAQTEAPIEVVTEAETAVVVLAAAAVAEDVAAAAPAAVAEAVSAAAVAAATKLGRVARAPSPAAFSDQPTTEGQLSRVFRNSRNKIAAFSLSLFLRTKVGTSAHGFPPVFSTMAPGWWRLWTSVV